jgi:hypothetical protein
MISLDEKSRVKSFGLAGIYYDYSGGPVPGIYKTDSIFSLTGKSDYNINNTAVLIFHNNMNILSLKRFNSMVKFTKMNMFNNDQGCRFINPIFKYDFTRWPLRNRSKDNTYKLSEYQDEYNEEVNFTWLP